MRLSLLVIVVAVGAVGCRDTDEPSGSCVIQVVSVPGTDLTDETAYCADDVECAEYCDAARNIVNGCWFEEDTACYRDLADAELPVVCALYRNFDCGTEPAFEPFCDYSCSKVPDTSEYDTTTGCTTEYAGPVVQAYTCQDALDQL